MIPAHVAEDMIRRANIAMWAPGAPKERAQALFTAMHEFIVLYGANRFRRMSGVCPFRLRICAIGKRNPQLRTLLKMLPYLGLRARIERDPNPRHPWRPMSTRALFEQRLIKLRIKDPSGKLAEEAIAKNKARRAKEVKRVQAYYLTHPRKKKK